MTLDRLTIETGVPRKDAFTLRLPPEYADEFLALLDDNDLEWGEIIELSHSAGTDLVYDIQVGTAAMAALATTLKVFFDRHKHKKFSVTLGKTSYEVEGISEEQAQRFVAELEKQKRESELAWQKVKNQPRSKE